ncbi:MAG: small multi-drug export protein [Candidatus Pacebacteria bacterium]|nr:small multi-drug export protein [Candidatus Paceibacterota bacterium]
MNHLLEVFLFSMAPIAELRGSIPLGIAYYNLPIWQVFLVSVLGNTLVSFILLYLIEGLFNLLPKHFTIFRKIFNFVLELTKRRHSRKFEIYRDVALVILVAIPLPLTGAWTASLCAFVFNIPKLRAVGLIFIGLLIAGLIVTLLTLGIISI